MSKPLMMVMVIRPLLDVKLGHFSLFSYIAMGN